MTKPIQRSPIELRAELFPHGADVGVRGIGPTRDAAFEQAALALDFRSHRSHRDRLDGKPSR